MVKNAVPTAGGDKCSSVDFASSCASPIQLLSRGDPILRRGIVL